MASKVRMAMLMPIRNMDRALKFYTKQFGAKVLMRGEGAMKNWWASVKLGDQEIWMIVPEKREPRTLAYTTLIVSNIKTYVKGLQQRGVKFLRAQKMSESTRIAGPIAFEKFGASAFCKDSEGNVLMIWEEGRAR